VRISGFAGQFRRHIASSPAVPPSPAAAAAPAAPATAATSARTNLPSPDQIPVRRRSHRAQAVPQPSQQLPLRGPRRGRQRRHRLILQLELKPLPERERQGRDVGPRAGRVPVVPVGRDVGVLEPPPFVLVVSAVGKVESHRKRQPARPEQQRRESTFGLQEATR